MIGSLLAVVTACTTFLVQDGDQLAVGKSYDWDMGQGLLLTNKKGVKKKALLFDPRDRAAEWTSEHASLTFNQYGREFPNGGINDAGLVIEIMWLEGSVYPPRDQRAAVNELQWIQYQLDTKSTVGEVVAHVPELRVSPASGRVHYLACDANGGCASFEYVEGKLVVNEGAKTLTNHTYAASKKYLDAQSGTPSSTSSLDRFVRATRLAQKSSASSADTPVRRAFAILDSVRVDNYSKWNIVYEPKLKRVHFRTDRSKAIKTVALDAFDAACSAPVQMIDIDAKGAEGEIASRFKPYDPAANARLLDESLKPTAKSLPKGAAQQVAAYPDTTHCQL